MSSNTVLNPGLGGDNIRTDDVGGAVKIPVSKLATGAAGVDGGMVTTANPLPMAEFGVSAVINIPNASVTTSAAAVASSIVVQRGVLIQADPTNGGTIYVGASGIASPNGYALVAGQAITIPVNNANQIFAYASAGTQVLRMVGV